MSQLLNVFQISEGFIEDGSISERFWHLRRFLEDGLISERFSDF